MFTTPTKGIGGTQPIRRTGGYFKGPADVAKAGGVGKANYDKVDISSESVFQAQLCARIEQQVQAPRSAGEIEQIKEQVQAGTYRPDAGEIAARLLLEGKF